MRNLISPPRVVFDANILISGVVFRGPPHLTIRAAEHGLAQSVTCEGVLASLNEKLTQKFAFEFARAAHAVGLIRRMSAAVATPGIVRGVCRDPDDDLILDCALAGDAAIIVTGDKDLLVLNPFTDPRDPKRKVEIIRAVEFLSMLGTTEG